MLDAVIVSTARTGLAKSWKGAFNMTHGATLGGHVLQAAIARAEGTRSKRLIHIAEARLTIRGSTGRCRHRRASP